MWLKTTIGVSDDRLYDVLADEVDLIAAQVAESLKVQSIDQRDEVHTMGVEAVPAVAESVFGESLSICASVVPDRVVFARNGEDPVGAQLRQHLLDLVELGGGGKVCQVAAVHDEVGAESE